MECRTFEGDGVVGTLEQKKNVKDASGILKNYTKLMKNFGGIKLFSSVKIDHSTVLQIL